MLLYKLETLKEYTTYLKQHTHEINVLYQDLLINVTAFFIDGDSLEFLRKSLLPKIIRSKLPNDPIRVWVPACSTGEEEIFPGHYLSGNNQRSWADYTRSDFRPT